eukprot:766497-Hanusia_phi.AAC.1
MSYLVDDGNDTKRGQTVQGVCEVASCGDQMIIPCHVLLFLPVPLTGQKVTLSRHKSSKMALIPSY